MSERREQPTATGPDRGLDVVVDHPRLIKLRGRLDHDTALMLAGALKPYTTRGGTLRVDVAGLESVDATGIEVLLEAARRLGRRGRLVVRDPSPAVKQLITRHPVASVDIIDRATE